MIIHHCTLGDRYQDQTERPAIRYVWHATTLALARGCRHAICSVLINKDMPVEHVALYGKSIELDLNQTNITMPDKAVVG